MSAEQTRAAVDVPDTAWIQRFDPISRIMHVCLMASFLGLALTGLPLLFAEAPWAARMAALFGGYGVTGLLHRTCAIIMIATFAAHLGRLLERLYVRKEYRILWGPDSLVPQPSDIVQLYQHIKYFLGLGERPRFDRYTYWEKFDYWAVFWGMGVIGTSGLMLWFPRVFAKVLPGWMFNIAFVVHGEEALLATGFIFTVHFFNGHLRPEKFPMDTVIFTGGLTAGELRHERPAEYERTLAEGRLARLVVPAPTPGIQRRGRILGTVAVILGLVMVTLTAYALLHS